MVRDAASRRDEKEDRSISRPVDLSAREKFRARSQRAIKIAAGVTRAPRRSLTSGCHEGAKGRRDEGGGGGEAGDFRRNSGVAREERTFSPRTGKASPCFPASLAIVR